MDYCTGCYVPPTGMSTVAPANARSGSMKKSIRPSAREAVQAAAAATRQSARNEEAARNGDAAEEVIDPPKNPSDQSVQVNPDGHGGDKFRLP